MSLKMWQLTSAFVKPRHGVNYSLRRPQVGNVKESYRELEQHRSFYLPKHFSAGRKVAVMDWEGVRGKRQKNNMGTEGYVYL